MRDIRLSDIKGRRIETYTCTKQRYNKNMGVECYCDDTAIFFIDKNNWVDVGDKVECERDDQGFYRRIWVNGELKTNDHFNNKKL